ncbi:hypothetical protein AYO44_12460 [Planctomycetaceae bacterium SCGC AG-212-F19]|nr:hypothetical protein AYO44_12460 [Planctomycetaceae bacterium SCGC AG-212-F19]
MRYIWGTILLLVCLWLLFGDWLKRFWQNRGDGKGGFRDWVKNPEWREAVEDQLTRQLLEQQHKLEEPVVPLDLSEAEIQELVEHLLQREQSEFDGIERLEQVGAKAVPALLAALADPRFHQGRLTKNIEERTPFQIVANTLAPYRPPEAVPLLAPFVRHRDKKLRETAGEVLAYFGYAACIDPVSSSLNDEDAYVRNAVLGAINKGIEEGHANPKFLEAVFDRIVPLLNRPDATVDGLAPLTLLAIDRQRAIPVLFSEQFFTVDNREVHYILKALTQRNIPVPREQLIKLLEQLRPQATEYPHEYSFGEALVLLAQSKDSEAQKWIREALQSTSEKVREEAARALGLLHGLDDPVHFAYDRLRSVGYEDLTQPQQALFRVHLLAAEVRNGGFAQYFVNSSGDMTHETLKDLTSMRLQHTKKILQEAMELFGPEGPSPDRKTRGRQLAALSKKQDAILDRLNSAFYEDQDYIDSQLLLYAIEHKEHFQVG